LWTDRLAEARQPLALLLRSRLRLVLLRLHALLVVLLRVVALTHVVLPHVCACESAPCGPSCPCNRHNRRRRSVPQA